jgi:DNA polymerase-3 subunit delta'
VKWHATKVEDVVTLRHRGRIGNRRDFSACRSPRIFAGVPLLPIYGHAALRARLAATAARGALPSSLLLHGPRGVGKQQLALWVGRALLCESGDRSSGPCGVCKSCRLAAELHHPDLHWFFPRPRLKGGDPDPGDVREDLADAIAERLGNGGLYDAPGGDEGIHVATVRAIVQTAALAPAMGTRKAFVVGDADRMVAQEGAEYAANAFLKLLEEPPSDTTLILTTSEPGALLPTIRSRVVMLRVPALADSDVRAFLADATVAEHLDLGGESEADIIRLAGGAPGRLVGAGAWKLALGEAKRLLDAAAAHDRGPAMRVAFGQSPGGARGKFSDMLDALTLLLRERAQVAAARDESRAAAGAASAVETVEQIKEMASGNVNPQLLTASLLRRLQPLVR